MNNLYTKYGKINGISSYEAFENGNLKFCNLNMLNNFQTPIGILTPQYEIDSDRRTDITPIYFHDNGNIKSISLQSQIKVNTSVGIIPAEYILFYPDESVQRIFPLNAKLSGFWSEEDEYTLAENISFNLPCGNFDAKVISLLFYQTGELKSITFWPHEHVTINSPVGTIECGYGISFYKDGSISSLEPKMPLLVTTPIGHILPFDNNPLELNGDANSLKFYEDGSIKSLKTTTDRIEIIHKDVMIADFKPASILSILNYSEMETVPLIINFHEDTVTFNNNPDLEYSISSNDFNIYPSELKVTNSCSDCSNCLGCC